MGLTTAALLIAGVAWAADGAGVTVTDRTVVPVAEAGSVTLEVVSEGLSMIEAVPQAGWTVTVETSLGREVEARFVSGTDAVDFNAELEDGEIRVEIKRSVDGSTSTSSTRLITSTSTSAPSSTSTSVDDSSTSTTIEASTSSTVDDDRSATSTPIDDDELFDLPDGARTFNVGTAGSVTIGINGGRLSLTSVSSDSGWSHDVEKAESDDIRVEFEKDDDDVEIRVRINNGHLEVVIDND